jgi:hypothetical protein
MKKYKVTSVDTGVTVVMTRSEAHKLFGRVEFKEILAGYLPHLIAVETSGDVESNVASMLIPTRRY